MAEPAITKVVVSDLDNHSAETLDLHGPGWLSAPVGVVARLAAGEQGLSFVAGSLPI